MDNNVRSKYYQECRLLISKIVTKMKPKLIVLQKSLENIDFEKIKVKLLNFYDYSKKIIIFIWNNKYNLKNEFLKKLIEVKNKLKSNNLFNKCNNIYNIYVLSILSKMSKDTKTRVIFGILYALICIIAIIKGGTLYNIFLLVCASIMSSELITMVNNKENPEILENNIKYKKIGIITILANMIALMIIRTGKQGFEITIWMFILVWTFDIAAFIVGKKFGKYKIAPNISPNKTFEGAIAGTIASLAISSILYQIFKQSNSAQGLSLDSFLILTLINVILAQYGDLAESWIKRKYKVKDSGVILPGHGGLLDRFDSLLIIPIFIYIFTILNKGIIF